MSYRWTNKHLHQVHLCKSLCWKEVLIMLSAFPRHICSRSIPLSFTSATPWWPLTPFEISESFPTWALKSPKMRMDSLVLTFHMGITRFFHEFGIQCTWAWCVYPYQAQGAIYQLQNAHRFSKWCTFINTICQLRAAKYTHPSLGKPVS